jgi:hypothetical protein
MSEGFKLVNIAHTYKQHTDLTLKKVKRRFPFSINRNTVIPESGILLKTQVYERGLMNARQVR